MPDFLLQGLFPPSGTNSRSEKFNLTLSYRATDACQWTAQHELCSPMGGTHASRYHAPLPRVMLLVEYTCLLEVLGQNTSKRLICSAQFAMSLITFGT